MPALVIVIVIAGVLIGIVAMVLAFRTAAGPGQIKNGIPTIGQVVSISQTGSTVNNLPQMKLVVRLSEGDSTREVTWRQIIDLGTMPRVGDRVRVEVDPAQPSHVKFVGFA